MKKMIIAAVIFCGSLSGVAMAQTLDVLQAQRQAVKLKLDLIDKKIDLEKAIIERDKREAKAAVANSEAESLTQADMPENADPKEAKKAERIVKRAENANKSLERGNQSIIKLEAEIKGLEVKIANARYLLELKEQN